MLQINTRNEIILDGQNTRITVKQTADGTLVRYYYGSEVFTYDMPHKTYSLACDNPASGIAGRAQFERDIKQIIGVL